MNLLTNIVKDYLVSDGWEIEEIQQPSLNMMTQILLSRSSSAPTPDIFRVRVNSTQNSHISETGSVEVKIHETKIEFCHISIDVHSPDSFMTLSYCLKLCAKSGQCVGCPIYREFYSLLGKEYSNECPRPHKPGRPRW